MSGRPDRIRKARSDAMRQRERKGKKQSDQTHLNVNETGMRNTYASNNLQERLDLELGLKQQEVSRPPGISELLSTALWKTAHLKRMAGINPEIEKVGHVLNQGFEHLILKNAIAHLGNEKYVVEKRTGTRIDLIEVKPNDRARSVLFDDSHESSVIRTIKRFAKILPAGKYALPAFGNNWSSFAVAEEVLSVTQQIFTYTRSWETVTSQTVLQPGIIVTTTEWHGMLITINADKLLWDSLRELLGRVKWSSISDMPPDFKSDLGELESLYEMLTYVYTGPTSHFGMTLRKRLTDIFGSPRQTGFGSIEPSAYGFSTIAFSQNGVDYVELRGPNYDNMMDNSRIPDGVKRLVATMRMCGDSTQSYVLGDAYSDVARLFSYYEGQYAMDIPEGIRIPVDISGFTVVINANEELWERAKSALDDIQGIPTQDQKRVIEMINELGGWI